MPVAPLAALGREVPLPGTRALETAQDRLSEKRFVEELRRPRRAVARRSTAPRTARRDRRRSARRRSSRPAATAMTARARRGSRRRPRREAWVAIGRRARDRSKAWSRFDAEFSVLLCRGADGDIALWDSAAQRARRRHPRAARSCPRGDVHRRRRSPRPRALARQGGRRAGLCRRADAGIFRHADGPVFNEMAPRVHNCGHWTIEGARHHPVREPRPRDLRPAARATALAAPRGARCAT